jgi:hypothetical protein
MSKYKIILITLAGIVTGISLAKLSIHSPFFTSKISGQSSDIYRLHGIPNIRYIQNGHAYCKHVMDVVVSPNDKTVIYTTDDGTILEYFKDVLTDIRKK